MSPSSQVNATRTPIQIKLPISTELNQYKEPAISETFSVTSSNNSSKPSEATPSAMENWNTFKIKNGDTLSNIFIKAGFNDKVMYEVLQAYPENKILSRIYPNEEISFLSSSNNSLEKIKLTRSPLEEIVFEKNSQDQFSHSVITREPEVHTAYREGTIDSSLFLSGQKAGMTEAQIMELANIFGWDIDFILDIREGDKFNLLFEELFLDGEKYKNGRILAANFTNQGTTYSAVLYEDEHGVSNYYTPTGDSMRKAFIRTPVDFARISSHFNLNRKHPILHTIRAHKGTDYAASYGTPIKATGDGKVIHSGNKGGYGKTVILQHGNKITTLYAHLSKYAKGITEGSRVRQGQIIGYIGSSGLASGPHLHYEFRVDGVHKNPLKVKLPDAEPISGKHLAQFKRQTDKYLAQLSTFSDSYKVALNK